MPEIPDGETVEMQGSGSKPYLLKNVGGVYSCTCPAWRNQSTAIEQRTCKHLRKYRGDAAEETRLGGALPAKPVKAKGNDSESTEPPLLLAESWDNVLDPAGWWMSEKLDGVRAYWDGRQFLSRQGNLYHAPDWFIEGLPDIPLDGELWLDRKAFQRTVSIVRRQDKGDQWRAIRFLIFDAPAASGPFEERVQFLNDVVNDWRNEFTTVHAHTVCRDLDHLRAELHAVERLGGEGLMLRQPGSSYVAGRSATLLKIKTFHDAEATVIGHERGRGRHAGRLGALVVRLPNGKEFSVGTGFSDREREDPPVVGSTITFRYQELSDAGIPRFPSFVGLRVDVAVVDALPATKLTSSAATKVSMPSTSDEIRYFELVDGKSAKFWEVGLSGTDVSTRWGKIGTAGQSKTKSFASEAAARKEFDSLIRSKVGGGYSEAAASQPVD